MNKRLRFITVTIMLVTLVCYLAGTSVALAGNESANGPKPGQAVVKVVRGKPIANILKKADGVLLDSIHAINTYLIGFDEDQPVDAVIAELQSVPEVEYAATNTTVELPEVNQVSQAFPDQQKPIYADGLYPASFFDAPTVFVTGLDSAHIFATGKGVTVAVIDNGLDLTHPMISSEKIKFGYDFVDDDTDPTEGPGSLYGHGTFVTGLVLLGAPECTIQPLRAFDGDGIGDQFQVAKAIYRAIDTRADLINMSFGTEVPDPVLQNAVSDALAAGIVMVASSGNDGARLETFPAAFETVIAVTSFDSQEVLADFANYGDYIDICAPGVNLYSALPGDMMWGTWSGTSFSSPLVAATVALIKDLYQDMTPEEIKAHLRYTARKELLWGGLITPDTLYGYGALDAYQAVSTYTTGDLDADGERTEADLEELIEHTKGKDGVPRGIRFRRRADINCDGRVNVADVLAMAICIHNNWQNCEPCRRTKSK